MRELTDVGQVTFDPRAARRRARLLEAACCEGRRCGRHDAGLHSELAHRVLRYPIFAMTKDHPARRVLFICQFNRCRSATAERLFCRRADLDVRSAGTSPDALTRVNRRMIDWADVIFVMDEGQLRDLRAMFPNHPKLEEVICLEIPDEFGFLDPPLVELLKERVGARI
jgi:predicted protein tyrosine phosphatase